MSRSWQIAPPTSVARTIRHQVQYPRSSHMVVWALLIGPLFHICALDGQVSITMHGRCLEWVVSRSASHGVLSYLTGGWCRDPWSTTRRSTGCWFRRFGGYRCTPWMILGGCVTPVGGGRVTLFRRTEKTCFREGHASLINSRPPSMTPKLLTQGSAAVGAIFTSTPTAAASVLCLPVLMCVEKRR
jgi:hypothetical protein